GGVIVFWPASRRLHAWRRAIRTRQFKQQTHGITLRQFSLAENADNAVFAVITSLADHAPFAHARNAFGQQWRARLAEIIEGCLFEDEKFGAELADQAFVSVAYRATGCADAVDFREHLRQGHQAAERRWFFGPRTVGAVGQFVHTVHDTNGEWFATGRAQTAVLPGFLRCEPNTAGAVAV